MSQRRNGLTPKQTGIAAYGAAHDVAANHVRRGLTVIADAANPVTEAREGWRDLAKTLGVDHLVVETVSSEHRRRVETRVTDLPGWVYPNWAQVHQMMSEYQPRTGKRLVLDTTRPVAQSYQELTAHLTREKRPSCRSWVRCRLKSAACAPRTPS
jgi:predicted kinase